MNLLDVVNRLIPPGTDEGQGKIPWDDPAFSRRMLENHLSQDHDWASRREGVIDGQVARIAATLSPGSAVLDLGCGPGLYTAKLARAGYRCTGVDFSPASIAWAVEQAAKNGLDIRYELSDVREFAPDEQYDAVLVLFGEINVFAKAEAERLVATAAACLKPGGRMFIETHVFDEVRRQGMAPASWESARSGLFSDSPHVLLTENFWDGETATARYVVVDAMSAECRVYTSRMAAYQDDEYEAMFGRCGFTGVRRLGVEEWPVGETFEGKLQGWECRVAELMDK